MVLHDDAECFILTLCQFGVIVAQVIFQFIGPTDPMKTLENAKLGNVFAVFAAFMFSGLIVTFLMIPETKGKSLEQLSNEDQRDFIRPRSMTSHVKHLGKRLFH